jgi:hypothetical protein
MAPNHYWYKPAVVKRVRVRITIIVWMIGGVMLYLNHGWIWKLVQQLF